MSRVIVKHGEERFFEIFDSKTGFYMRSGVLDEAGKDTGVDPFKRSFPSLIDVGVMGHCIHGAKGLCVKSGVKCYQSGLTKNKPNMSLDNFKTLIKQCKGKVFQIALGGRGDVNKHESFEELLAECDSNGIVPNYTTSGLDLTADEVLVTKKYCGAVAVSEYRSDYTNKAIDDLISAGVKTNIHYVLGNFSIDEAIHKLKNNGFHKGINAVIFLMHKPVGLGGHKDVLSVGDPKVAEFFGLIDKMDYPFKIGFDSCSVPAILNFNKNIDRKSLDTCEGARWSMYVSADMMALPCSFDQEHRWAVDLNRNTIKQAWDSDEFEAFRGRFTNACSGCADRLECLGGCPIVNEIVLCGRSERKSA